MTTKEELRQLVNNLSDEEAADLLDYAHWLLEESESLTTEELARVRAGEGQIRCGDFVTLDELKRDRGNDLRSPAESDTGAVRSPTEAVGPIPNHSTP